MSTTTTQRHIKLTSAEIANVWSTYMNDSLAICILGSFLANVSNPDIRAVLEFAMTLSQEHIERLKSIFVEEGHPIPDGFSESKEVYKSNSRLYTDEFYLFYIQNLGKSGMTVYAQALACSARLDICQFYTQFLNESAQLFNKATELMLSLGIFIRAPYIPIPKQVEYVQHQSYLAGLFTQRRPLNVIELTKLYTNLIHNQLGRTLLMGFSQVAQSAEVRNYMMRGRDIADKHVQLFGSILLDEFLPQSSAWSTLPTDSTTPVFSDKLMMVHTSFLNIAGIGYYGTSLATSPRRDLSVDYVRLIAEVSQYEEDGANILIKHGWFEQPPQAADRDQLAKGE